LTDIGELCAACVVLNCAFLRIALDYVQGLALQKK